MADAATEFAALAYALREAGETGLKRELDKALNDAAQPLAKTIGRVGHLQGFMPDRYAGVLAPDLKVTVRKRSTGTSPGVTLVASAPLIGGRPSRRGRNVPRLNRGVLAHPLFGDREHWYYQTDGVTRGFFDRPVEDARPQVRRQIEQALARTRDKIYAAR